MNSQKDEAPRYADEEPAAAAAQPWKVLIADDDRAVHAVTKLALGGLAFHGRPVTWFDAYSGEEAVSLMREHPDMALVLMDVVMENDCAGLEAAQRIREDLDNKLVRIAVRTGQPGVAHEESVVRRYGIDAYREKTELTTPRLSTLVHTSLAHYQQLRQLEVTRAGLHRVIEATLAIFRLHTLPALADGLLHQLSALLGGREGSVSGIAAVQPIHGPATIISATGEHAAHVGQTLDALADARARASLALALRRRTGGGDAHYHSALFNTLDGDEIAVYVGSTEPIAPESATLAELFCRNMTAALGSRLPRQGGNLAVALTDALEARSRETGNHVRRVAEYARLLGQLAGLDARNTHLLFLAAPLHDAGKIGIPDAVLHKPGAHTAEETAIMRSHAELGQRIFAQADSPVLEAAAIVAGQHHERWDGKGYPNGMRGEDIHVYGRIIALIDVFDALTHPRCYKDAWPLHRALDYLVEQSGRRFDPALVELFMQNLDQFLEIHERLRDGDGAVH